MKLRIAWVVLLTVSICKIAAQETRHLGDIQPLDADRTLNPLENRNGWVNPEDLAPMPQCVARQDTTTWLSVMTQCVWRQCTRHFGVICTHHQWLIQLSCLSTAFSPDVVREYLPQCSRSVLAKAQLFRWIHTITGRTWLVDIGDAINLQSLSPTSLIQGYDNVQVTSKAPTCLVDSLSPISGESFQNAIYSCAFSAETQHTGNAARPWEYNEGLRSLVALDSETIGYDLTNHIIAHGNYFDKQCFCKAFSVDLAREPCSGPGLAITKERLWMVATCGSTSLPSNWTDGLQTTVFDYIPTEQWRWPACVDDIPKKVTGLLDRCTTQACEIDSGGYCNIKHTVDRACFCSNISYNTCKGSCHIFETRFDYVNWLHRLCGKVDGWHGLPKNWPQLAGPTVVDMIPWNWSVTSLRNLGPAPVNDLTSPELFKACPSNDWKLASLVLINTATLITANFLPRQSTRLPIRDQSRSLYPTAWLSRGLMIAGLYLLANWINAALVQSTSGYESVPVIRLALLWSSMPRMAWLSVLLVGVQPWKATGFSTVAANLFAESILQALSSFHMFATVNYGWKHSFYNNGMERLEVSSSAQLMYAGALLWLLVLIVALVLVIQTLHGRLTITKRAEAHSSQLQANEQMPLNSVEVLMAPIHERWTSFESKMMAYWIDKSWDLEEELLLKRNEQAYTTYGTLPIKSTSNRAVIRRVVRLYLIAVISMILLSIAQWLFWAGFIGLSLTEYCPPNFTILTGIWIVSAVGSAVAAQL